MQKKKMSYLSEHLETNKFCPFCRSTDFGGDEIVIDGVRAVQNCTCYTCNRSWTDVYVLAETYDVEV